MDIKAVLFDLDGTIVNSEPVYFEIWKPILVREFGLEITLDDWFNDFVGHTMKNNVAMLNRKHGLGTTEDSIGQIIHPAYASADFSKVELMPAVREVLTGLQAKGIRMGVVTSSYRPTVNSMLEQYGLLPYFDFLVTREDITHPKPDPEPYLLGIERMQLPSENILAIEDTIAGTTAARSAGLICLSVSDIEIERKRLEDHVDYLVRDLREGMRIVGL